MRIPAAILTTLLIAGCAAPIPDRYQDVPPAAGLDEPDIAFGPTPPEVVDAMLRLAGVGPDDIVYDLGSGDGRIPIAAARNFGARGVGIEIDTRLIAWARDNAEAAGVADRVSFRNEDIFAADFSDATVVTLFLWPSVNRRLRPKLLAELKPGTRIVSHDHAMGNWTPDRKISPGGHAVYLWTIPER